MQWPLTHPETLFEELLQDLPAASVQMARAFQACVRAKQVKTPAQLLRMVFFYGGWDKPLREVAGTLTALYESMTAQSGAERWRACGPWVPAMLRPMVPLAAVEPLPSGRRCVVLDASSMQAPGATGTDHRLHLAMDVVSWQCLEVLVSDVHTGATLTHCPFAPGDVAVTDRAYAQCQGMPAAVAQGADLMVRRQPFRVVRRDTAGAPVDLGGTLHRQRMETLRTLAVTRCAAGGQHAVRGWVHASRLHAEQAHRARHTCRQGHTKGTPSAARLVLAGWVLVCPTRAPAVLPAQTIMALYRCRGHVEIAIKRWKRGLEVDALRAQATSPLAVWRHGTCRAAWMLERRLRRPLGDSGGRRERQRVGTWWRVWGMRKDERGPRRTGAFFWKEDAWAAGLKVLVERPRRRT